MNIIKKTSIGLITLFVVVMLSLLTANSFLRAADDDGVELNYKIEFKVNENEINIDVEDLFKKVNFLYSNKSNNFNLKVFIGEESLATPVILFEEDQFKIKDDDVIFFELKADFLVINEDIEDDTDIKITANILIDKAIYDLIYFSGVNDGFEPVYYDLLDGIDVIIKDDDVYLVNPLDKSIKVVWNDGTSNYIDYLQLSSIWINNSINSGELILTTLDTGDSLLNTVFSNYTIYKVNPLGINFPPSIKEFVSYNIIEYDRLLALYSDMLNLQYSQYNSGYDYGYDKGYDDGEIDGYDKGYDDGEIVIDVWSQLTSDGVLDLYFWQLTGFEETVQYGSEVDNFFHPLTSLAIYFKDLQMSPLLINYGKVIYHDHTTHYPFWKLNLAAEQLEFYSDKLVLRYAVPYEDLEDIVYEGFLDPDSEEIFELGKQAGYNEGFADGKAAGDSEGYDEGYDAGYNAGKKDYGILYQGERYTAADFGDLMKALGYDEGYDEGYTEGRFDGYREGNDEGWLSALYQYGIEIDEIWMTAEEYGEIKYSEGYLNAAEFYGIYDGGFLRRASDYGDLMYNKGYQAAKDDISVGHKVEFYVEGELYFQINSDQSFMLPQPPTKEGETFLGWYYRYTDQLFNILRDEINEETTLVARFSQDGGLPGGGTPGEENGRSLKGVLPYIVVGTLILAPLGYAGYTFFKKRNKKRKRK